MFSPTDTRLDARRAPLPLVRGTSDLPERQAYPDDGCEVASSCLACPLSVCRFDVPGGLRALLNLDRDYKMRTAYVRGTPVATLVERFDISRRQVYRVVKPTRRGRTMAKFTSPQVASIAGCESWRKSRPQKKKDSAKGGEATKKNHGTAHFKRMAFARWNKTKKAENAIVKSKR